MTREHTPEGTPSEDEVEQDFTVPADADLRPVVDGEVESGEEES